MTDFGRESLPKFWTVRLDQKMPEPFTVTITCYGVPGEWQAPIQVFYD
jgi:hypothetical protein